MVRSVVTPEPAAPEFAPRTLPTQPVFNLADIGRLFGKRITTVHYWLLSGNIREATRTSARGEWRVPRQEVIRLLAEAGLEIPGLWTRPPWALLVDDDEKIRRLVQEKFKEWQVSGFEVAVAATLREARAIAKELKPKIIIVDCFLPKRRKLDSSPTLSFIRWVTRAVDTSVIGLSGWKDMRDRMLAAGAVAFVHKPFKLREVLLPEIFALLAGRRREERERRRRDDVVIADMVGA